MTADNTYRDKIVYLTDLFERSATPKPPVLIGFVFENCQIRGPLVAHMRNCNVVGAHFDVANVDDMLIEIDEGRSVVGPVLLDGCTFENCQFSGVGLIGSRPFLDQIRQALAPS